MGLGWTASVTCAISSEKFMHLSSFDYFITNQPTVAIYRKNSNRKMASTDSKCRPLTCIKLLLYIFLQLIIIKKLNPHIVFMSSIKVFKILLKTISATVLMVNVKE